MKQLLSLFCLFVLTLGVAQAYSPPEEFNDQATIEMATNVDQLTLQVIAPDYIQKADVAEIIHFSEAVSNINEDAALADLLVGTVPDVDEIAFNFKPGSNRLNFNILIKETRHRDYLLDSGRELVPAVPWRSLSKWSTDHRHYIHS